MARTKRRVELTVDATHVPHIRSCLANMNCEDFTVSPVISGWGMQGYWSSECKFADVGRKVAVRFSADEALVRPLIAKGFGILAMDLIPITETAIAA